MPSRQRQHVRVVDHPSIVMKRGSVADGNVVHAQASAVECITMEIRSLARNLEFAGNDVCAACLVKAAIEGTVKNHVRGRQKSSIECVEAALAARPDDDIARDE